MSPKEKVNRSLAKPNKKRKSSAKKRTTFKQHVGSPEKMDDFPVVDTLLRSIARRILYSSSHRAYHAQREVTAPILKI
jgi:hypothetical protein